MSLELPDEMLNGVNRKLRDEVVKKQKKLQSLKMATAEGTLLLEDNEEKLRAFAKTIVEWNGMGEVIQQRLQSEESQVKTLQRELSNTNTDLKRSQTTLRTLKNEVIEVQHGTEERKAKIQKFLSDFKLSERRLEEIIESQREAEDSHEVLEKMTEMERTEYLRLMQHRDALINETKAKRTQVENEMQDTEALRIETLSVLKQATTLSFERSEATEQLEKVFAQSRSLDLRHGETSMQIQSNKTVIADRKLDAHSLEAVCSEVRDNVIQNERRWAQYDRKRGSSALLCDKVKAEDERLFSEVKLLEGQLIAEKQTSARKDAELHVAKSALRTALLQYEEAEDELYRLQHDLDVLHSEETNQDAFLRRIAEYKEEHIAKLNTIIQTTQKAKRQLEAEIQENTEHNASHAMLSKNVSLYFNIERKQRTDILLLEQRHADSIAANNTLDEVKSFKLIAVDNAKADLNALHENLLNRARSLREELDGMEHINAPLKAANTTAHSLLLQCHHDMESQEAQKSSVLKELNLTEIELQGLRRATESLDEQKALKVRDVSTMQKRIEAERPKVVDKVEGVEHEEQRKIALRAEMKEREEDIRVHQGTLRHALRLQGDERSALSIELNAKKSSITLLRARYEEVMNTIYAAASMYNDDLLALPDGEASVVRQEELVSLEPEEIQAKYIASIASIRLNLQDKGDMLDSEIVKIHKSNQKLNKALLKLGTIDTYRSEVGRIAFDEPTAFELIVAKNPSLSEKEQKAMHEFAALRQNCLQAQREIDIQVGALYDQSHQLAWVSKQHALKKKQLQKYKKVLTDAAQQRQRSAKSAEMVLSELQRWAANTAETSAQPAQFYERCRRVLDRHHVKLPGAGMGGDALSWGTPQASPIALPAPPRPTRKPRHPGGQQQAWSDRPQPQPHRERKEGIVTGTASDKPKRRIPSISRRRQPERDNTFVSGPGKEGFTVSGRAVAW